MAPFFMVGVQLAGANYVAVFWNAAFLYELGHEAKGFSAVTEGGMDMSILSIPQ